MPKRIRKKIFYDLNQGKKKEYGIVEECTTETMEVVLAKQNLKNTHVMGITLAILIPILSFVYYSFAQLPLRFTMLFPIAGGCCFLYEYIKTYSNRVYLKNRLSTSIQEQKQKIQLFKDILGNSGNTNLSSRLSIEKSLVREFVEWFEEMKNILIESFHFEYEQEAIPKITVLK